MIGVAKRDVWVYGGVLVHGFVCLLYFFAFAWFRVLLRYSVMNRDWELWS